MKIDIIDKESMTSIEVIDYNELLKRCNNDVRMARDVIIVIRKHPDRNKNKKNTRWASESPNQIWQIIEDDPTII